MANGSGPVLRDTARLSQRYPLLRTIGFLVSQHGQLGAIPLLFSERFSLGEHAKWICDTPPSKGVSQRYSRDYPLKTRQINGCDTPLCDTISKGYCALGGGVSRTGPLSACLWQVRGSTLQGRRRRTLTTHTPLIKGVEVHPLN